MVTNVGGVMRLLRQAVVVLVFCGWFAGHVAAQEKFTTPLIPREVLFGNPERTDPQISPDGTQIGYLAPVDGVLNVWIRTLGNTDDRPVTADKNRGIRNCFGSTTISTFSIHRTLVATRTGGSIKPILLPNRRKT